MNQATESGVDTAKTLRARAAKSADEIEELESALGAARDRRDDIVVEMVDGEGISIYETAKANRLSPTRVSQILARASSVRAS